MYNHAPKDYKCPFCKVVNKIEDAWVYTKQKDVFYRDAHITAFVSSHSRPNNEGNVIIIPNKHIENIYTLPNYLSNRIHAFEKRVALAMKKIYWCDGVSCRQHNELDGGQDVWHYHYQIFPRYKDDDLYQLHDHKKQSDWAQRSLLASKLRAYFI